MKKKRTTAKSSRHCSGALDPAEKSAGYKIQNFGRQRPAGADRLPFGAWRTTTHAALTACRIGRIATRKARPTRPRVSFSAAT